MITICLTYFKSLALANLRAALFSVRQQDLSCVKEVIVVDNDTPDARKDIWSAIAEQDFPVPVRLLMHKHGDPLKTHSWSTNVAVRASVTPWIFFTRADYILEFDTVKRFTEVQQQKPAFITGNAYHLAVDVGVCETLPWRKAGAQILGTMPGAEADYTVIDAGVWMLPRNAFDQVDGLDEDLTAWGHAQTHFQHKLYTDGVWFVRLPGVRFYHPQHSAPRDISLAHQQLRDRSLDLKLMWARYHGASPY